MNHNNVISLPTDLTSTYVAGDLVSLNSQGQAVPNSGSGVALGVVLHDVQATETGRPVDLQLLGGGGIALINGTGAINKGDHVGYGSGAPKKVISGNGATTKIGIAQESLGADVDGLIRVILL